MELISGLIVGLIFGFLLKKSRFCPTGIIRDVYLEKRWYNIALVLSVIFTQSLIYFLLVKFQFVTEIEFEDFSLLSIALGSFLFGIGAVITNGCMTSSLVKFGDGRIIGILSVIVFMITGYITTNGFLHKFSAKIATIGMVEDNILFHFPINPIFIVIPILIVVYYFLYKSYNKYKPKFKIPQKSTGLKYVFFEKIWPLELASILIGLLMGVTYIISEHSCTRTGGISISSPLMSWVYTFTNHQPLISGG